MAKPTEPQNKVNPAEKNSSRGTKTSGGTDLTGIFRQVEVPDPLPPAETRSAASPLHRSSQPDQAGNPKNGGELTQSFRKLDYPPSNGAQKKTGPANDSDDLDAGFTELLRTLSNESHDEPALPLLQMEPEPSLDGPGEFTSIASRQILFNAASTHPFAPHKPEKPLAAISKANASVQSPAPSLAAPKPVNEALLAGKATEPQQKSPIAKWVPWVLLLNLLLSLVALLIAGALSLRVH
jgi:hypothetical protein